MWVVIDGNNWFSRAWFALKPTSSQSPAIVQADLEQRCIRSIETVVRWIDDIARELKPTMLAVCWDSPASFRRELFPEYKADHNKPAGYREAMRSLKEILLGRHLQYLANGYEADDLLAGFAREAIDEGERCVLCSSDKDLHQCLVDGCVSQCTRMARVDNQLRFHITRSKELVDQYGVKPWQWVDYRCLTGDPSDGLPGVYGIGPKIAVDILTACGTLDKFYEEPFKAPITAAKRVAMLAFKPQVPLMRKLMTLCPDAYVRDEVQSA